MKRKLYTMDEVAAICLAAGLTSWPSVTAVSIAWAESGGNAYAVNINDASPPSIDLGMWQTNSRWHPEVTPEMALTPELQIVEVMRIAKRVGSWGYIYYNWSAWMSYVNGYHKKFTQQAYHAVKAAGGAL